MKSFDGNLIERLCRLLAYHAVETELTLQFTEGDEKSLAAQAAKIAEAKALIAEAGFDFDQLYPPEERPTGVESH